MLKTFCAFLVASAGLLAVAPSSHAAADNPNKLGIDIVNHLGTKVRAGTTWDIKGRMYDANGKVRCKNSGYGKVSVDSVALSPTPNAETTNSKGRFIEEFTIKNTPGEKEVTATCNKWTFTGHITVVALATIKLPPKLPPTGAPVPPMAGTGLGMIGIGWILVFMARYRRLPRTARRHPGGRPGQVRR
jgi:hypothetical protein